MSKETESITKINPAEFDFTDFDFSTLPVEVFKKFEETKRGQAKENIVNLRKQLLAEEQLHLDGDADYIDSYGKTVVAIARDREKEGVTLGELATVMQPEFLRKAIKNLDDNGKIVVKKLHPDGEDSGNKKYIYLPDFAPVRK